MDFEALIGSNAVWLVAAAFIVICILLGVRIVSQSEKHVVERFGRLRAVLGPGINFIVPFLDRVAHKISILERQLPAASQDAITADNVLVKVETSVFYRITEPEKTVYRIRDVDAAIATTVAGIVRSEIGKLELDQVQSNRSDLILKVREQVAVMVDDWGIEVTRAEILEGKRRAVELNADGELYAAEQDAKARRVLADAEAYATVTIAAAIKENGIEAAQYQVALKQVEALTAVGQGAGKQVVLVPAAALDAFANAFQMLKGRG